MALVNIDRKLVNTHNDDDNLYYNIKIVNTTTNSRILAEYSVTRVSPIVDTPSDYELAVTRFGVPATRIPIMVWGSEPYDVVANPSSKVDRFIVTMSYDGASVSEYLTFIPNSVSGIYGQEIWSYQEFIDIINVALRDAFLAIKAIKGAAPPVSPPYMTFDPETQLCTLYSPQTYDTGNPSIPPVPVDTIAVYFNGPLFKLFPSFETYYTGVTGSSYRLLIKSEYNNSETISGTPYYLTKQKYPTIALWSDFRRIVFETDSIPVEPEYQPTLKNVTRRLITDFEPDVAINNRERFQYSGSGWKRYYDLKSQYPLRTIDLRIYWQDNEGKLYPIYISKDESASVKLLFRKKLPLRLEEAGDYDD